MEEAEQVKTILSANWNAANTDNVTPVIDLITNRANVDARLTDFVFTYNVGAGTAAQAGAQSFTYQNRVSIDIRSVVYSRFKKIIDEIMRIIEGKYLAPGGNYHRLVPLSGRGIDLSDKTRNLFRRVIDVSISQDLREFTSI